MKVYVVNGKKAIKRISSALVIVALVVLIAVVYHVAGSAYSAGYEPTVLDVETEPVIVIDAGHGGEDPGAVGVSGVYEKDINLAIALQVGEELTSKGYKVVYTRTEDKMLYSEEENIKGLRKLSDLKNRCKISAESAATVFVSIHMNSYGESKYSGLQVYYASGNEKSRELATKIQNAVRTELQPDNDRKIKEGKNLYLLENCTGTGVLVECGFLTNSAECEKLSQKEYQKQLSFAIVCGIIEHIEGAGANG